ncbi:cell envelope biogenesis protein OmpA [Streptomyces acidiscabies]|uniref:Cell envelope biogenesis protein OmpA n=1 Tax=Streptomyces acidiscabies TaxID=42234 RepID=A0ABU4LWP9_9ACTN|nr:cell envelope biogenesis protein OmpA [Streptomyces acidiscabies]MDX3020103.1 cell envelope biogenesis protein OmpA [Streptomyces acidiscabies]
MTAQLPVPTRCAGRPTLGGLLVPWITLYAGGRYLFGALDKNRRDQALAEGRCQVCGQGFDERICLAVRPADVSVGYTGEPGMHPECLAYSVRACPMLSGEATHYRTTPASSGLPGVTEEATGPRAGHPAEAFDAWWITPGSYRVKTDPEQSGELLGVDLDVPVLRKRPIRPAQGPDLDSLLTLTRQALGLEDAPSNCPYQPEGAPQPPSATKEND